MTRFSAPASGAVRRAEQGRAQILFRIARFDRAPQPLLLAIVVCYPVCLYRFSPNVRHHWRDCVPGALLGAVLWICAAVAFRISAAIGLSGSTGAAADNRDVVAPPRP